MRLKGKEKSTMEDSIGVVGESIRLVLMYMMLGLVGGLIHACEEEEHTTLKRKIISIITAGFTGTMSGMILSTTISSPTVLGGVCAMTGYGGVLILRSIIKAIVKKMNKVIGD